MPKKEIPMQCRDALPTISPFEGGRFTDTRDDAVAALTWSAPPAALLLFPQGSSADVDAA